MTIQESTSANLVELFTLGELYVSDFLQPGEEPRADECTGLENRRGESHRGFESLSLRHGDLTEFGPTT